MSNFHHRKLPEFSTLLSGPTSPDNVGFRSTRLQIWFNNTDQSWIGDGEKPHLHQNSDECFAVLDGSIVVEVEGERFTVGSQEFCCFPAGVYHAIHEVNPPVKMFIIRAPSGADKIYSKGVA